MTRPDIDGTPTPAWSIEDLLRPDAFAHDTGPIELRETHISWVVLTGPLAYKIKKPVRLDFIDASTLERRREFCTEELRLNRRLAPELYLDVVAITHADGKAVIEGTGAIVDYAVRMRQFPADDELQALLERNEIGTAEMSALGALLADFHGKAAVAAPESSSERTERLYELVLGNLNQLMAHLHPDQPPQVLDRLLDWTRDTANELEPMFQERERGGFVRECHGDLHAGNIVMFQGRLTAFDCIEFDPALRWIDVMNDIAFLVMDLASHQRTDLAFSLLSRYLEVTGDYAGIGLLRFYAVYRALVRAKVDALSAAQVSARSQEFLHRLRQRVRAAEGWTTPRQPILVLMHGPSGSGKSWLSEKLVPELSAVRIRSDLERKRLAGIAPAQSASAGVYSQEFNHRTYSHLLDCAESCLRAGISAIVDAAFLDRSDRELFLTLASRLHLPHVIVSCHADPETLAGRIFERSRERNDPSDADVSVLDAQLRGLQPFQPEEQGSVISVDTKEPEAVRRVAAAISARGSI